MLVGMRPSYAELFLDTVHLPAAAVVVAAAAA
jgi:hypothetical protein